MERIADRMSGYLNQDFRFYGQNGRMQLFISAQGIMLIGIRPALAGRMPKLETFRYSDRERR